MKKKYIALLVIIILLIIGAVIAFSGSFSSTTVSYECFNVTVPAGYSFDDNGTANSGDVHIIFVTQPKEANNDYPEYFKVLEKDGEASGYHNVSCRNVDGLTIYEYTANPKDLKNVSVSSDTKVVTYKPIIPFDNIPNVDHFRVLIIVDDATGKEYQLIFYTTVPDVNLHTPEINNITSSIVRI